MRPEATEVQLATAVILLLQGLLVEDRVRPDAVADIIAGGLRTTAFAAGVRALLDGFTVPLRSGTGPAARERG